MTLSAPTQLIFWISVILAVLGIIGLFATIPFVTMYAFWFVVAGYIVLAAGCLMKGV